MAASAFAGTGVMLATGSATLGSTQLMNIGLGNSYSLVQGSDGKFSIRLSSATKFGPVSGLVLNRLWQDLAEIGFKS